MPLAPDDRAALLAVLQDYLGLSAPWILTQAERRADDLASLKEMLVRALKRAEHREPFSARFDALFSAGVSSISQATKLPAQEEPASEPAPRHGDAQNSALPALTLSLAERRLLQFVGDQALGAAQRLSPPPATVLELYAGLAELIADPDQRERFLKLCPGGK